MVILSLESLTTEQLDVCVLAETASEMEFSANQFVIDNIEIYNNGDLKWLAMLLGMADMSNIWCIYCLLRKHEWMEAGHALTEDQIRTIAKNLELADSAAMGTNRFGVKFKPYWPFIPILNYIVPLLHIMIGVFNDILDYFMKKVEAEIIVLPPAELKLRDDLKVLNVEVKQLLKTATEWRGTTPQGKHHAALLRKKN